MNTSISKGSRTSVYDKARRAVTTIAGMTVPVIIKLQMAFASNVTDAGSQWLKIVFRVIGAAAVVGGIVLGIMSAINYGEAKGEGGGGGPEMAKAKNGFVGAAILLAIGVAVYAANDSIANAVGSFLDFNISSTTPGT